MKCLKGGQKIEICSCPYSYVESPLQTVFIPGGYLNGAARFPI